MIPALWDHGSRRLREDQPVRERTRPEEGPSGLREMRVAQVVELGDSERPDLMRPAMWPSFLLKRGIS